MVLLVVRWSCGLTAGCWVASVFSKTGYSLFGSLLPPECTFDCGGGECLYTDSNLCDDFADCSNYKDELSPACRVYIFYLYKLRICKADYEFRNSIDIYQMGNNPIYMFVI